jgi:hypothetical protein
MDPTRPKCVATIIHEIEPLITTDNLECVQPTCASSGSSCKTGESCSANFYNTGGAVPDICLPDCLGNDECPPNYACAYNAGASGAAHVCIPGIPGERCNHEEDCIWGDCLETGAGFSECIVGSSCKNDNNLDNDLNCAILNGPDENFACAANGRCVGLTAFNGTACTMDRDCPSPQSCFFYSPYTGRGAKGECRVPCPDLTCSPRGGVPEVCLDSGAGGCYPGNFALPCTTSSECLSEFTCMAVSPDPRTIIDSPTICTISCATDDDCQNEPFIRNSGFCLDGVCRFSGRSGSPCSRDTECQGGMCANGICS